MAFTISDELCEVFAATVKPGADAEAWTGKSHRRGGYPKRLVFRSLTEKEPRRWTLSEWTTEHEEPYTQKVSYSGAVDLGGVRSLLDANDASDAAWLLGRLSKAARGRWDALLLKARIQAARKRHKGAARSFKRAVAAEGRPAEVLREYGRYLASRRVTRRRAKVQLERYLEEAPEAADREAVLAEIEALQRRRKRK